MIHNQQTQPAERGIHSMEESYEAYAMQNAQFDHTCCTGDNIHDIYNEWLQWKPLWDTVENIRIDAEDRIKADGVDKIRAKAKLEYLRMLLDEDRKKRKKTMNLFDGYCRQNSDGQDIPVVISSLIYIYYKMTIVSKINELFQKEMDKIGMNAISSEQHISEPLDRLAIVFPMMKYFNKLPRRTYFYAIYQRDIGRIVRRISVCRYRQNIGRDRQI
eukprot:334796_1